MSDDILASAAAAFLGQMIPGAHSDSEYSDESEAELTPVDFTAYLTQMLSEEREVYHTSSGCLGFTLAYGNYYKKYQKDEFNEDELEPNEQYVPCCWQNTIKNTRFYGKVLIPIPFRKNRFGEKIDDDRLITNTPVEKTLSDHVRDCFFSLKLKSLLYADSFSMVNQLTDKIHRLKPDLHEMDADILKKTGKPARFCMIPSDCFSCT